MSTRRVIEVDRTVVNLWRPQRWLPTRRTVIYDLCDDLIDQSEALCYSRFESVYRRINYVLFYPGATWILAVLEPGDQASDAERKHMKRLIVPGSRYCALWKWRDTGKKPRYELEIEEL